MKSDDRLIAPERYRLFRADEPALQARFPQIRTYTAQGIDDPAATVRFDRTPLGFHAQILSPNGRVFIDPYRRGDTSTYASYYTRDYLKPHDGFQCLVTDTYE